MAMRPGDDFERDILDIIPERYDADADSHQARAGHRLRTTLTLVVAVVVVGGIVAAGWRFMGGKSGVGNGIPVIKADDRPIKMRPDDRGGMQVPNQDKLVYERMDGEGEARTETLLPPPEQPQPPPKAAPPVAPPKTVTPPPLASAAQPAKPGEPAMPKSAPQHAVSATSLPQVAAAAAPPPAIAAAPPPPVTVAPPPPPTVAVHKPPASGDYLVQLGAVRSADAAEKEFARIQKANAELLSGLKPDVVRVELGEKGVFWRVRAGPLSEQAARQLCLDLAQRNQGCILVRK